MSEATKSIDIITAEAAEWFALSREEMLTREQRGRFLAWLSASPLHIQEYLGVAESWGAMQVADCWSSLAEDEGRMRVGMGAENVHRMQPRSVHPFADGRRRLAWRSLLMPAVAAAVLMLGFVLNLNQVLVGEASYRTGLGEQRSIVLEDGTIMQLNAVTHVRVRLGDTVRRIELVDGEAYFKVAHDAARPFDVVTREAVVRAIGTAFNVYRREGKLDVAVTEGRVRVTAGGAQASAVAEPVFLDAHEGVVMRGDGRLTRMMTNEAITASAWKQRRLVFDGERLDTVVAEFNRYTKARLQVDSAELAGLRISGTFNADDPETLIAYLEQIQAVRAERADGRIILQRSVGTVRR